MPEGGHRWSACLAPLDRWFENVYDATLPQQNRSIKREKSLILIDKYDRLSMSALPSLRQLGYLVEVAARLNFRAAAEASFVTQSTLSAGIKELESSLGVE